MNASGYNTFGSFRDFYLDASYGLLDVTTTVSEWITVSQNHDYYADNAPQMVYEALVQADAYIDFSQFDNDADGYVDGIAVIHQGPGQEASGDVNDIWSHSWYLGGYSTEELTFDGVVVQEYTTQPEIYSGGISTIGVMCHEFGHNLGAPDFYDTNYEDCGSFEGTGQWDLMAGGSWNNSGQCPANHNILTKQFYGWIEFESISSSSEVTLLNSYENPFALIYSTNTHGEYFLMENRQQIGFDQFVPNHGLLIYHFDENYFNEHAYNNTVNTCEHQGFYPKAWNGSVNSSNTTFPGNKNQTDFNDFSNPNSISWDGLYTDKPLSGITELENTIYFDFMGGWNNPSNLTATASETDFAINIEWNLNSNSDPVLLVYGTEYNQIGLPENGVIYSPGDVLSTGGEVIFYGADIQSFLHENLDQSSLYYYRIFSNLGTEYSSGEYAYAKTICGVQETVPYLQDFESFSSLMDCWNQTIVGY